MQRLLSCGESWCLTWRRGRHGRVCVVVSRRRRRDPPLRPEAALHIRSRTSRRPTALWSEDGNTQVITMLLTCDRLWRNNNRRLPRLQSWDSYFGSWFGFSKGKIVKYDIKPSGSAVLMRRFMFSGESHQEEASSHSCSRGSCGWFIVAPPTRGAHIKTM